MIKSFRIKNLYIIIGGLLIITYILLLISTTYLDQKKIEQYQSKEIQSHVKTKAVTLEYFFNSIKKDFNDISNKKEIYTYFQNKDLGMSMQYGLKASLLRIDRILKYNIDIKNINGIKSFKEINIYTKDNKVLSASNIDNLIDLKNLDLKEDAEYNEARFIIKKNENKIDVYLYKNIYFKNQSTAKIIASININTIFKKLIQLDNTLALYSMEGYLENDLSSLNKNSYFDINIKNTPFILRGINQINTNRSFFSKWFVLFLALLALPILVVLYFLTLLNNKNIKLNEEKNIVKVMLQQSKMAAMGEMISNIAHQWRQPLSVISAGATGMKVNKEYGVLNDASFYETCENININAQYLSKTIDDFRNFILGDRQKTKFLLNENINNFNNLVEGVVKNHKINLILDTSSNIEIMGYPNELIQCFINIFNNSKDAFVENNIKNKFVFISTSIDNNKAIIKIKDNAGGIDDKVLPRIFEPYFTTKHQSQGTGIGLHMTYSLIVEGMKGTINTNNLSYKYKSKNQKGVEFIITLPIK